MLGLDRRVAAHELLDGETLDAGALRLNLREMAQLNRLPGGTGASIAAIESLRAPADGTFLDVGTGGGDLPRRLRRTMPDATLVAVDARPDVLAFAAAWTPSRHRVELRCGDARALPLDDASVDVAHASLLIHHLDPGDAVTALIELRRVARRGVVINDLRRGVLPFLVTAATVLALSRGTYTRHDGVLSARRAYSLAELDDLAASAGLRTAWRSTAFMPRVATAYR
jgi:ubiquinone/menaquinone biosynthesis C-methylase UbiE